MKTTILYDFLDSKDEEILGFPPKLAINEVHRNATKSKNFVLSCELIMNDLMIDIKTDNDIMTVHKLIVN